MNDINNPDPFNGVAVDFKVDKFDADQIFEVNSETVIPRDEGNRFYRRFLKWEAEGNTIHPATTFQQRKDLKLGRIQEYRNKQLMKLTVTVGGKTFPADSQTAAYLALVQAAVNGGTTLPTGFNVRTVDGEKMNIDASELQTYIDKVAKEQFIAIDGVWDKVDAIKAAATDNDLDAVDLDT